MKNTWSWPFAPCIRLSGWMTKAVRRTRQNGGLLLSKAEWRLMVPMFSYHADVSRTLPSGVVRGQERFCLLFAAAAEQDRAGFKGTHWRKSGLSPALVKWQAKRHEIEGTS